MSEDNEHNQTPIKKETTKIQFWAENPNVLLNPSYFTELFPSDDMSYNQKLNAITRMIILLTIVVFLITGTFRSVLFGIISTGAVYLVHYYYYLEKKTKSSKEDTFTGLGGQTKNNSPALSVLQNADNVLVSPLEVFDQTKTENPFSNVLVTDINGNPTKKPAPPAYNDQVNKNILAAAKESVLNANPEIPIFLTNSSKI